jgi:hypothetical protein
MTPWRLVVEDSRRPTLGSTTIWSLYGQTYTTISVNSSVWTSIPKWTLVAEFQKEDEVTITTVIHFSIAILSEHIR